MSNFATRDAILASLGFSDYEDYLRSPMWQTFRQRYLSAMPPPMVCNRCKAAWWACELVYGQRINLHHKTYENLGKEKVDDIEILCRRCHELEHLGKSESPRIILRACRFCTRPKIVLDPPMTVDDFRIYKGNDLESVEEIIAQGQSKAPIIGKFRRHKLSEIMNHPTCRP